MKQCKACGKDIAKGVKKCVHCGKDQRNFFMRHKIFTGILAIIALVIVVNLGDGDSEQEADTGNEAEAENSNDNNGDNESTNAEETKENDDSEEVEKIKIGDPAEIEGVTFIVNDVEETDEIDSGEEFIDNAETSGKFVILDVTVENDQDEAITIDSSFFKIITDEDKEHESSSDGDVMMAMGDEMNDFFIEDINPGIETDGKVVFEVSDDVDVSKSIMEAQTGFWGTETVEVELHE